MDPAILICKAKLYFQERYKHNDKENSNYPLIDKIGLQGGALNLSLCLDNQNIEEDIELFNDCLHKDDEILSERLYTLSRMLKEIEMI